MRFKTAPLRTPESQVEMSFSQGKGRPSGNAAGGGGSNTPNCSYAHSNNKDEETKAALAKLRQYESLRLIKVEVDEVPVDEIPNTEDSHEQLQGSIEQDQQLQEVITGQVPYIFQSVGNSSQAPMMQQGNKLVLVQTPVSLQSQLPTQLPLQLQAISPKPTHEIPVLTNMEGDVGFTVTVEEKERTTKSPLWLMSRHTLKLYTNINKAVPFEVRLKKNIPRSDYCIRAYAAFSSAQFLRTNVTRCPNHANPNDITNHDFPDPAHVIRADHPCAQYETSPTGRMSVVLPLDDMQEGSDFTPILLRFMCLGSCVGGINRRPIVIILTLEHKNGQVCGRSVIHVRVCACPTRDIKMDEQQLMNKGVKRRGSSLQIAEKLSVPQIKKSRYAPIEPKREVQDDEMYYIPVRGRKLYEFLVATKEAYIRTHPEYKAQYPDQSFQGDDDGEEDMQRVNSSNVGMMKWHSGGESPTRIGLNSVFNDNQIDISNENKHGSSPLSKLTPNISISHSTMPGLRLFEEEVTDEDTMDESQDDGIGIVKGPSISRLQSAYESVSSQSDQFIINSEQVIPQKVLVKSSHHILDDLKLSKHIPVKQIQSYKSGRTAMKDKSFQKPGSYVTDYGRLNKSSENCEKRNSKGNDQLESIHPGISYSDIRPISSFISDDSPEMLAANVLAEGFNKYKTINKQ